MSKQLSGEQIRVAIVALRNRQVKLTGSIVRSELRRRYGSPGGVTRVYRLLQEFQLSASIIDYHELVAKNKELNARLVAAEHRAAVAEEREEAHQTRWAMEVDSLRQQLQEALGYRRQVSQLQDQLIGLHRQIRDLTAKG